MTFEAWLEVQIVTGKVKGLLGYSEFELVLLKKVYKAEMKTLTKSNEIIQLQEQIERIKEYNNGCGHWTEYGCMKGA